MNPVIGLCPICSEQLSVTQLHCRHCDTRLSGSFALGRLYQLTPEQLEFVELFVRCEGKLNRVGEELDLSYPAVRSRLEDVILALGYDVGQPPRKPVSDEVRKELLRQVAAGELSAEEAIAMLQG